MIFVNGVGKFQSYENNPWTLHLIDGPRRIYESCNGAGHHF